MRSHVLNWLWLCFAFYCSSVNPTVAGTRNNHKSFEPNAGICFQQKDTTVKPTANPVVIKPSSDTTKPGKDSATVVQPDSSKTAAKDTTKKPASDTALILPGDSNT
ncbi:MAG TPA: hypothetical protein VJ720_13975, partial [Chitinophaga sp.]|nr:hypothetical protein [Chitinophaga sp.]